MQQTLAIFHNGMLVQSFSLENGKYTLGRSGKADIVIPHLSVPGFCGSLSFRDGAWLYQGLEDQQGQAVSAQSLITLSPSVSIAAIEILEEEDSVQRWNLLGSRGSEGPPTGTEFSKWRPVWALAVVLGLIAIPFVILWKGWFQQSTKKNPNQLLSKVRSHIVELEGVVDPKAIADYKNYAKMKDTDFKESLGFCTGSLVAPNIIMTAAHCLFGSMVIDMNNQFIAKTKDGKIHKVKKVLGFDIKRDFLFLEGEGMESYGHLSFAKNYKIGQSVYTVGNVHGEGIAIRDGILTSVTQDQNDPSIQFIRYNAGTSPGNSGGPLLDEEGRIVALVFASTWTENYNLGTTLEDLKKGFGQFVKKAASQPVKIQLKKLLSFNAQTFLQSLALPYLSQFEEYPEIAEKFENMGITLEVPIAIDSIDEKVISLLNKELEQTFADVQKFLIGKKEISLNWKSFVSKKTPAILPSQFDMSQKRFVLKNNRMHPKLAGLIDSPSKTDMKSYRTQLDKKGKFDFQAYGYDITIRDHSKGFKDGDVFYMAENKTGRRRRLAELGAGLPFMEFLLPSTDLKKKQSTLTPELFLQNALGESGVLANSGSRYSRPKSAKDFVLMDLKPDFKKDSFTDKLGRLWKRTYFKLFDSFHVYTYCYGLPEGEICLSRIFNILNDVLLKTVEKNFTNYILSHLLVNPYFWDTSKLLKFLDEKRESRPLGLKGIELKKTPQGPWFRLSGLPYQFKVPSLGTVQSLRIQNGLYGQSPAKAQWVGYGLDWVSRSAGGVWKVCGFGVEPLGSQSRFILNFLRDKRKEAKREKQKGKTPDPLPGVWYQVMKKAGHPTFQAYGYCAPLVKDPFVENEFFVDFKKSKALKVPYEIL